MTLDIIKKNPLTEQINNSLTELKSPTTQFVSLIKETDLINEFDIVRITESSILANPIHEEISDALDDNEGCILITPIELKTLFEKIYTLEKKRNAISLFVDLQIKLEKEMNPDAFIVNRKSMIHNINHSTKKFNNLSSILNRKIGELAIEFNSYIDVIKPKEISYKEIIDAMCQRKDADGRFSFNMDGFKMTKRLYREIPKTYKPSTQTIVVTTDIRKKLGLEEGIKVFKCDLAEAIMQRK